MRNRAAVTPDARARWTVMTALAVIGLADSAYLTWYHYDPAVRVCIATSGCETVNTSRFATLSGVPVAGLGVLGYALIVAGLAAGRWGPGRWNAPVRYAVYALAAAGTAFSLYLTAIEAFVLHAYCAWCLVSAAVMTVVCITATADLAASPPP